MDLLRPRAPQHVRRPDPHGEWIAARTVALRMACEDGSRYFTVRPVGVLRRWRWYAVSADFIDGVDMPFSSDHEGRAFTKWGAQRAARAFLDPTREMQEALRDMRYAGLGARATTVVRALDRLARAAYLTALAHAALFIAAYAAAHEPATLWASFGVVMGFMGGALVRTWTTAYVTVHAPLSAQEVP